MDNCNLDCFDDDTFRFPGANKVTAAYIQGNSFVKLPEGLLWHMESLTYLFARNLIKLVGLPGKFFQNLSQLVGFFFTDSQSLGVQRLPDELFRGLIGLKAMGLGGTAFPNMPVEPPLLRNRESAREHFGWVLRDPPPPPPPVFSRGGGLLPSMYADVRAVLITSLLHRPDMVDLVALESIFAQGPADGSNGMFQMTDEDSEATFDSLVSCKTMFVPSQRLTRIPSLKKMRNLNTLALQGNKITRIEAGDFAGATQLVKLNLASVRNPP